MTRFLVKDLVKTNVSCYNKSDSWEYINYLDTGNLTNNVISEVVKLIPGKDTIPSRAKRKVKQGDILYSTVRPNLRHFGYMKNLLDNMLVSTGYAVLEPLSDKVCGKYLYYYLTQREIVEYLHSIAEGTVSTYPSIQPKDIEKISIDMPELDEQKVIASVLSTYDDLIEKNNRKIEILQEMAEELYKEWFVRFRFPGYKIAKFTDGIPDGWEVKRCGDISTIKAGGDAPKEYSEIKTDKYKYPIFSNGISEDGLYGYTDKPSIKTESITISARGTVGFVCLRNEPYLPIVRLLVIVPNTEIVSSIFLYMYFKHNTTEGYGTSQQQITVPYFKKKKILLPNKELINKYTGYIEPLFNEVRKLKIINDNLKQQRDLLLPRLMSGKLEVKVS